MGVRSIELKIMRSRKKIENGTKVLHVDKCSSRLPDLYKCSRSPFLPVNSGQMAPFKSWSFVPWRWVFPFGCRSIHLLFTALRRISSYSCDFGSQGDILLSQDGNCCKHQSYPRTSFDGVWSSHCEPYSTDTYEINILFVSNGMDANEFWNIDGTFCAVQLYLSGLLVDDELRITFRLIRLRPFYSHD